MLITGKLLNITKNRKAKPRVLSMLKTGDLQLSTMVGKTKVKNVLGVSTRQFLSL